MSSILVVDDVDINRVILREILSDSYDIIEAENGMQAIEILFNTDINPEAILLDIMMPGMDGFQVLETLKSDVRTENLPVLFITAADANINESRGLMLGASDYISKPFNPDVVKLRLDNHIQLKRYREDLESMLEEKTAELVSNHERTLETLATIIEYRSLESGTHIRRSSELTRVLIDAMVKDEQYADHLRRIHYSSIVKAVALHDIGKVGIPDNILLKPGKLTPEEFKVIETHTTIGKEIVETIAKNATDDGMYLTHCAQICLSHHENWNGTGYPEGLAGDQIPLSARILSVVDVYDALVNKRCYKPAITHEEAMNILIEDSGKKFDPGIIKILIDIQDQFREVENAMRED